MKNEYPTKAEVVDALMRADKETRELVFDLVDALKALGS